MNRRSRTEPAGRPVVQLTDRDKLVLQAIAECGCLSTEQLARLAFPSADRARRRLRMLHDARYLGAFLTSSRESTVFVITRDGLQALKDSGLDVTGLRVAVPARASALPHALMISDVRLYLAGLRSRGDPVLTAWETGKGSAAAACQLTSNGIAPDGLAWLSLPTRTVLVAVECDRGNEGQALTDKISRYFKWFVGRSACELWLIVSGGEQQIQQARRLCLRLGVGKWARVLSQEWVNCRPVKAPPPRLEIGG